MNGEHAELPEFLQAQFDRQGDPLDERQVQEWLLAHPQYLEQFASLRAALLASAAPVAPVHRRPLLWRVLPLAAASVLVALAAVHQCGGPAAAADRPLPRPDFATSGRIVHFSTCTTVTGSLDVASGQRATVSTVTTAGQTALQRVATITFEPPASSSLPLCVMATSAKENQPSCIHP